MLLSWWRVTITCGLSREGLSGMRLFQSSIDGKGPKRTYKDSASWKIGRLHAMKLFLNHFALEEHKLFVSLIRDANRFMWYGYTPWDSNSLLLVVP